MQRLDVAPAQTMDTSRRIPGLIALSLAGFLIQLDVTIVNVALPTIQRTLGTSPAALEWVVTGYALGLTVFIPIAGAVGDRAGRRTSLQAGLAVFAAGSIGAALSASAAALIAARIVQGAGGGAVIALALALLTEIHPEQQRRARAIGWWAAIGGTGFGAGPIVGGLLLAVSGWPVIFWINVPIVALTTLLVHLAVPSRHVAKARGAFDVVGLALLACSLGLITYGLTSVAGPTSSRPVGLSWSLAGFCVLVCFGIQQHFAESPFVPRALRIRRSFVGACIAYLLAYGGFSGALFYVTLYFQNVEGWSPVRTGLSWLLMNAPFLVVAQAAGRIQRLIAPRTTIAWAGGLGAVGFALLASTVSVGSFSVAAAGYVFAGVGFGLIVPGVTQIAMRGIPTEATGTASALVNSSRQLGTVLGLTGIGMLGASMTRSQWSIPVDSLRGVDTGAPVSGLIRNLPHSLQGSASAAFAAGFEVALLTCSAALLLVSAVAWWAFQPANESSSPDSCDAIGLSEAVRSGPGVRTGQNSRVIASLHRGRTEARRTRP
ncbi:Spectinomycin tetracycline efflux pump (plasmid) [Tsukamurella tyrosinosolvens]|uniref:MFS transporter, DHA2 family, methylenomycin A resistance protein n=1 Tax=Tsukamurella tyrosinosolvens TaxID=57704 RepID=A0A1H4NV87_TSUTY|nr:MFS transporter [Tsukamurella tyrosinosolvens]KXO97224.1 hypothetical protein AXK58_08265 [Tsukamurella tyrosinosolvens]SEB99049.1 MFS transporter, DHA2 family, methylenomycin A resistance protein [Tsukamurella tyrosinosolvens]VEI00008.1 Spectinomycin tetracycline efflux pump [Tsukamurella tyrosinosolvens]